MKKGKKHCSRKIAILFSQQLEIKRCEMIGGNIKKSCENVFSSHILIHVPALY